MTDVDETLFRFERNTAVQASAGTGKTETLTALYVMCLAGATGLPVKHKGGRIPPSRILAITFTEKAAGEMRDRIRRAVFGLASEEPESLVAERFAAQVARVQQAGRSYQPPKAKDWIALEHRLTESTITTFHSFAGSLLRRFPLEAQVDPRYALLDEVESARLVDTIVRRVVRRHLDIGDEAVVGLVRAWRYDKVVELVQVSLRYLGERGLGVDRLLGREHLLDDDWLAEQRQAAHQDLEQVVEQYAALAKTRITADIDLLLAPMVALQERMRTNENIEESWVEEVRGYVDGALGRRRVHGLKELKQEAREIYVRWDALQRVPEARAHAVALSRLVETSGLEYESAKRGREVLDFRDLLVRARDLLQQEPIRRAVRDRYDVVLVDEFQDTDPVQAQIVRALRTSDDGTELLPSGLFLVGDRKQSIYGFRGADVGVFEDFVREVVEGGGTRVALTTSYRSGPRLIHAVNALCAEVFGRTGEFATGYDPERDDLVPFRGASREGPRVEVLDGSDTEGLRPITREARMACRRIAQMLRDEETLVERDGEPTAVKAGDIAILLPVFTHIQVWVEELTRCDVPFFVVKGHGFFDAQEVRDVVRVLDLLEDRDDAVPLAAVLRSPFVGLSDPALVALTRAGGGRLDGRWLEADVVWPDEVPPEERLRLEAFARLYRELRRHGDRIGPVAALQALLDGTGYRAIVAALPDGVQRVANLEKIITLAARRETAGQGDLGRFARELHERAEKARTDRRGGREGKAAVVEEGHRRAVTVMTIHAAKGLEFPVVVLAGMAREPRKWTEILLLDPDIGACLKVPSRGGKMQPAGRYEEAKDRLDERVRAEDDRLFYVGITRARDHLVVVGESGGTKPKGRRPLLENLARLDPERAPEDRQVDRRLFAQIPEPAPPSEAEVKRTVLSIERATTLAAQVAPLRRLPVRDVFLPVTALQEFALCPRRYRAAYLLGLEEWPRPRVPFEEEADAPSVEGLDPRRRGSMVHRLLELANLEVFAREGRAHLETLARGLGLDVRTDREIVEAAQRFLAGPYGKSLVGLLPSAVAREVPFLFVAEHEGLRVHAKGVIDLLVDRGEYIEVIDYKHTEPRNHANDYRFQLECYGAAVRAGLGGTRPVRLGIQFLAGAAPPPVWLDDAASTQSVQTRLGALGRALFDARTELSWEGHEETYCESIGCGYRHLCHGRSKTTAEATP